MKKLIDIFGVFGVILYSFLLFIPFFILMIIVFVPVLPLMLLAFPGIIFTEDHNNPTHWTTKPYMWYFNNVWLRILKLFN